MHHHSIFYSYKVILIAFIVPVERVQLEHCCGIWDSVLYHAHHGMTMVRAQTQQMPVKRTEQAYMLCVCVMFVRTLSSLSCNCMCICGCVVVKVTISSYVVRAGVAAFKSSSCPAQ